VKTVIVGCGRVGAVLADAFDRAGHEVIVIDPSTRAFERLPSTFGGNALRGDGTDEDTLRRAGAEDADIFIAMTEGDNRNVMAAQLAQEALGAKKVIAKINDPVRAEAYADLGLAALCRTNLMADAVNEYLGLPQSGRSGILQPTGSHPGGEHHEIVTTAAGAVASAASAVAGGASAVAGGASAVADRASSIAADRSDTTPSGSAPTPAREA
jgi:trk system potassium uptake protein